MNLTISVLKGQSLIDAIDEVARLRLTVFRDFPYLYQGSKEYEVNYLQAYVNCDQAIVIAVNDNTTGQTVGVSTALPLAAHDDQFKAPFVAQELDPSVYLYCAESVLLPQYRGQGLGHVFFERREEHAKSLGMSFSCFCAVQRSENHPLRPVDYSPLDAFWMKRGYQKDSRLHTVYEWQDIGAAKPTAKKMQFWLKSLIKGK